MRFALFPLLLLLALPLAAQRDIDVKMAAIEAEGRLLYRLERVAWLGTDLFRQNHPEKFEAEFGGYVALADGEDTKMVFFNRAEIPQAIATYTYGPDLTDETVKEEVRTRRATDEENRLLSLRVKAINHARQDTLFKVYENSNLNFVPLVYAGTPKVYVLSGPSVHHVVLFGNDYRVDFTADDEVTGATKLHNNIIPMHWDEDAEPGQVTMHSHNETTGELPTVTDVCTLLLYGRYTPWKQHIILGPEHRTFYTLERESFLVMTEKAMKKIRKHQQKMERKRAKKAAKEAANRG